MIRMQNISKHFSGPNGESLTILKSISLEFPAGKSFGIVGPSGSGKSTLMGLLAGLEKPSSGTIQVGETEISNLDERRLSVFRAKNVGIVFQSFHLLQHYSALQNVLMAAEISGLQDAKSKSVEALAKVGLAERMSHVPAKLSGGEQQRVAIARAIVSRPKLLLCDEPTGNLDPDNAEKVFGLLMQLQQELNATLIVVTHDYALAERLDFKVEIERGQVKKFSQKGNCP